MNTNIQSYFLWGGIGVIASLAIVLAFPSSFEWSTVADGGLSASERTAMEELNKEFQVTRITSLTKNRLLGVSKALPIYANVLTGLKQRENSSETEVLLETTNGEVMLLESNAKAKDSEIIEAYARLESVKTAEKNIAGELFSLGEGPSSALSTLLSDVPTPASDILIAVVDSGIDTHHPAFSGNLWENSNEARGRSGADDDGNGSVDDQHGWNFVGNNSNISDEVGHGTHIAGIIAGRGTSASGVRGVTPQGTDLMILKIADRTGALKLSNVISALNYAQDKDADMVNMSLGFPQESQILRGVLQKMKAEGIVIIAAAGNNMSSTKQYPAGYPETLAVGASNVSGGGLWRTSNFGDWVDVFAPAKLESAVPGGGYASKSGTSQAAALVTGFYAYYKSEFPEKSPDEIERMVHTYMDQFYKGYLSSDIPSVSKDSWVFSSVQMLKNNSLPTLADTINLHLSKRISQEEVQAFLMEYFGDRAPVREILGPQVAIDLAESVTPNELLDRKYTASLFSEENAGSQNLKRTELVKSYEAIALLRRVQTAAEGYDSLKAFPLHASASHLKYISRKEFLQLAFQILE